VKIAVVGSGISGLVCAHLLAPAHDVTLFEADDRLGGHTHTVDVETPSGRHALDTGFIVFNDWTYPNFIRLMQKLGVASRPTAMSFSAKDERTGLEYNGTDLNGLFAQRRNLFRPSFYRMIADILRFNKEAPRLLDEGDDALSLGAYLARGGYSRQFMDHYIIPMGAAIWSASVAQMKDFPARSFVRFFKNHGMLSVGDRPQWRVIQGGSRSYIPAMTAPLKGKICLSTPVLSVRRLDDGVELRVGRGEAVRFDHVIMAGHADQSLGLLSDASDAEKQVLGAFAYQRNDTVLHTDVSVLPRRRRAWASWNYFVPAAPRSRVAGSAPQAPQVPRVARVAVTYNMNILQGLSAPETFCVSLNMEDRLDPAKILQRLTYHHPVYTAQAVAAQARWAEVSGPRRTHFCGAYWGFGFHEDGVKSALRVCETFGAKL